MDAALPTPAEGEAYAKRVDKLLAHHHYKTPEQWAALLQLFNTLASPKLKPFGFSAALKAVVPTRLKPRLQKFYDAPANGQGGGLLVVGIKN